MSRRRGRHNANQISGKRNASVAVNIACALWSLCHDKGLIEPERKHASEAGLDQRWWQRLREQLDNDEGLNPRSPQIDAAISWASGPTSVRGKLAEMRRIMREHRLEIMGPLLRAMWPARAREARRAVLTVAQWAEHPGQLNAEERTHMYHAWNVRAALLTYTIDGAIVEAAWASARARARIEALDPDAEPNDISTALETEPMDFGTLNAVLDASERACAVMRTDPERIGALWYMARACEDLGRPARAMRLYTRVESAQETSPPPHQKKRLHPSENESNDPAPGAALERRVSLLWNSGEPALMRQAMSEATKPDNSAKPWRSWTKKTLVEQDSENALIDSIETATEALERAKRGGNPAKIDTERLKLAAIGDHAGLHRRVLEWCWHQGASPADEAALGRHCAAALENLDRPVGHVEAQWERALSADPHDTRAMLGRAECESERGLAQSAAVWVARALWTDRRVGTFGDDERALASQMLLEAGRTTASERIDRNLLRPGKRTEPHIAIGASERAIERGDARWGQSLDAAFDAIALKRSGAATLALLCARSARVRADKLEPADSARAQAESLRDRIRSALYGARSRDAPTPDPIGQIVRKGIRNEPRETTRACARLALPLAFAMRAVEYAGHSGDDALTAGALRRAASIWEEWAIRTGDSGHPTDTRALRAIARERERLGERGEKPYEWPR